MRLDENQILRSFSTRRVLLPVVIGLAFTAFLIWRNANWERWMRCSGPGVRRSGWYWPP